MSAWTLKQMLVELTRGGCRVEQLAHEPAVVTFRSPRGVRYVLAADQQSFRLGPADKDPPLPAVFGSLNEALRAACLS